MADILLCLNSGSSSLKFGLYERGEGLQLRARGKIEKIGIEPYLLATSGDGEVIAERRWLHGEDMSHEKLLGELLAEGGRSVLLVTHDLELAGRCDRALLVDGGRVVADGPAADVVHHYRARVAACC